MKVNLKTVVFALELVAALTAAAAGVVARNYLVSGNYYLASDN